MRGNRLDIWGVAVVLAALGGFVASCSVGNDEEGVRGRQADDRRVDPTGTWTQVADGPFDHNGGGGERIDLALWLLDAEKLDARLAEAPMEFSGAKGKRVFLPMPDRTFQRFRVVESPMLAPELAAKFPRIRTYGLVGIDDPSIVGRLGRDHRELHALLRTPAGMMQLNPDVQRGHPHYRSIIERPDLSELSCGFQDDGMPLVYPGMRPAFAPSGDMLRIYRLVVATTGEYYQARDTGMGTPDDDVMASITTIFDRVNLIYETEVAIRFEIIGANDEVLFDDPTSDGYTHGDECTMKDENTAIINGTAIDPADYDIGHVLGARPPGAGGCASGSVVCDDNNKGAGASHVRVSDPQDHEGLGGYRLVAHEMGHQFGAGHTWSGTNGNCTGGQFSPANAHEPLSGSTLMSYSGTCDSDNINGGNTGDPYFHARSLEQIVAFSTGAADACASKVATGNSIPVVDAGPDYTIPRGTPFTLVGSASDGNDADLWYTWEQYQATPNQVSPLVDNGDNPLFRSFPPALNQPSRTFPRLADIVNPPPANPPTGEMLPTQDRTLVFRLTARDLRSTGGGVDSDDMTITVDGSPFFITAPDGFENLTGGCETTVTWVVGGGDVAAEVDILVSEDGGSTFSPWISGTPNDGSEVITLPCIDTNQARLMVAASDNIFFDVSNNDFSIQTNPPGFSNVSVVGGAVDASCERLVTFSAVASGGCSLTPADVDVDVMLVSGIATADAPTIIKQQVDPTTVSVDGSILISDLVTGVVEVRVEMSVAGACGGGGFSEDVEVFDDTPPVIVCPADAIVLWVEPTDPGALGSATATDNCVVPTVGHADLVVPGDCLSETITRTWTAVDAAGNQDTCEQVIEVRGPADATADIIAMVQSLGLPHGTETSLVMGLENTIDKLEDGKAIPSANKLGAFVNKVEAQSGKKIAPADADALIVAAEALIDAIEQAGACP